MLLLRAGDAHPHRPAYALHEKVGLQQLQHLSQDGRCDPSQETLAAEVGCSDRTVRRANTRMQGLGLLRWQHRLVRDGWRAAQTSNAYELVLTENPPETALQARPRCGGQAVRQTLRACFS